MDYRVILSGGCTTLRWQYDFEVASDEMAIEYLDYVLRKDPCVKGAMEANLFNVGFDEHVARFEIKSKVEVRRV